MTEDDGATRTLRIDADLSGLSDSAAVVEQAFARSFAAIERQIGRAAKTGEFSFRAMVDAIVSDLSRIAVESFIVQPLEGLLKGLFDFGGARASGGPVGPGRSYLVGERGPELFTPAGHGSIAASAATGRPSIIVNVNARDAASFLKSEAQIGAMLSRAVARGARKS